MIAVFIDGPRALTRMELSEPRPVISIAIHKPLPFGVFRVDGSMSEPTTERIDYHVVAVGIQRKVALYSIAKGDVALLNLTLERVTE